MNLVPAQKNSQAYQLDEEARQLVSVYSAARVKIGLELAARLKEIEDSKLYLSLDPAAYPTFNHYLNSLNIGYKTAREIIGVYETYVLVAGKTIDELSGIAYHKLSLLKSTLFKKEDGQYRLVASLDEVDRWLADAQSGLTQSDLSQKIREEKIGEHEHLFRTIKVCQHCKLKEYV